MRIMTQSVPTAMAQMSWYEKTAPARDAVAMDPEIAGQIGGLREGFDEVGSGTFGVGDRPDAHGVEERLLVGEVRVDGDLRRARTGGHAVHAGTEETAFQKLRQCRVEDRPALLFFPHTRTVLYCSVHE